MLLTGPADNKYQMPRGGGARAPVPHAKCTQATAAAKGSTTPTPCRSSSPMSGAAATTGAPHRAGARPAPTGWPRSGSTAPPRRCLPATLPRPPRARPARRSRRRRHEPAGPNQRARAIWEAGSGPVRRKALVRAEASATSQGKPWPGWFVRACDALVGCRAGRAPCHSLVAEQPRRGRPAGDLYRFRRRAIARPQGLGRVRAACRTLGIHHPRSTAGSSRPRATVSRGSGRGSAASRAFPTTSPVAHGHPPAGPAVPAPGSSVGEAPQVAPDADQQRERSDPRRRTQRVAPQANPAGETRQEPHPAGAHALPAGA